MLYSLLMKWVQLGTDLKENEKLEVSINTSFQHLLRERGVCESFSVNKIS